MAIPRLTAFKVGDGVSTLFNFNRHRSLMVDCGKGRGGARNIASNIVNRIQPSTKRLDLSITHNHTDHKNLIKPVGDMLEARNMKFDTIDFGTADRAWSKSYC